MFKLTQPILIYYSTNILPKLQGNVTVTDQMLILPCSDTVSCNKLVLGYTNLVLSSEWKINDHCTFSSKTAISQHQQKNSLWHSVVGVT